MTKAKKGSTFTKHYYSQTFEDEPHYTAEITVDEDSNLTQMCRAFELFLKVSGYEFDGYVDIVKDEERDLFVEELVKNNEPVFEKGYPSYEAVNKSDLMSTFDEKM